MAIGLPSVRRGDVTGPEGVTAAADAFRDAGCLVVHDVFPPARVDELREAFLVRHRRDLSGRPRRGSLSVGDKRTMVTVRVRGTFADPQLYAPPLVLDVIRALLTDVRLFAFGAVVASPGATDQHVHRDGGGLFGDPALDGSLAPWAVTAMIPLVDVDGAVDGPGTTRVWPGTHRFVDRTADASDASDVGFVDPTVPRGAALLMDYRLLHAGRRNRSGAPRPALYNVYARPWFRDERNYRSQRPLVMSPLARARVPAGARDLFAGRAGAFGPAAAISRWAGR